MFKRKNLPTWVFIILVFFQNIYSNAVYAGINCAGSNWKVNNADNRCLANEIAVKTNKKNSYIKNTKQFNTPIKLSATVVDPIFMHWAGLEINSSLRLKFNNENRRLELLTKDSSWRVAKFIDSYHVFKQKDDELKVSVYLTSDHMTVFIDEIKVIEFYQKHLIGKQVEVALLSGWKSNIKWKNIVFEASAQPKEVKLYKKSNNYCAIDNVLFENSDHLYKKGELVNVEFSGNCGNEVVCAVRNIFENKVYEVNAHILSYGKSSRKYRCIITPNKYGTFKIEALSKMSDKNLLEDLAVFSVLPNMSSLIHKDSYFGGHIDGMDFDWHINAGLKIGLGWVRGHDGIQAGWWTRVQPDSHDQWLWPYDEMIGGLSKNNISILGGLLWTPYWLDNSGKANPPQDMKAYKKYVAKVVERYKSTISHWEVWNEPYFHYYWKGSPGEYVALVKNAAEAIKSVDKNIMVIGGVVSPFESSWNRAVFDADLLKHIDILSIHFSEIDYSATVLAEFIHDVRERGFIGEIWNTEARVYSQDYMDNEEGRIVKNSRLYHSNAAIEIIKLHLENISYGIDKVFYYHQINPDRMKSGKYEAIADENPITTGMWGRNNNPRSMLSTYTSLIYILNGSKFKEKINKFNSSFYLFSKNGYSAVAQLHSGDKKTCQTIDDTLVKACNAQLFDYQANKLNFLDDKIAPLLNQAPWYLVCHGDNAGQKLKNIIKQLDCT